MNYIDARTAPMRHATLFKKPCLYSDQHIQVDSVPPGWYSYCLSGTTKNPTVPATLEDSIVFDFAGSIISPTPLKKPTTERRRIGDNLSIDAGPITLAEFCQHHSIELPPERPYSLRPAAHDEADMFNSQSDKDAGLGTVGHVRMDFGYKGEEFWHTWWPHNDDRLNTPEFKDILGRVVNALRGYVLKSLQEMSRYCWQHPEGLISEGVFGYITEADGYRFCLRCTPRPGDYQGYLYCYQLPKQEYQTDEEHYAANRRKLQEAVAAGYVLIDYCGYDTRCHNCQYADSDTQRNAGDDFCTIICRNPACPLHAENRRPQ